MFATSYTANRKLQELNRTAVAKPNSIPLHFNFSHFFTKFSEMYLVSYKISRLLAPGEVSAVRKSEQTGGDRDPPAEPGKSDPRGGTCPRVERGGRPSETGTRVTSVGQRKCIFDVTSNGQRSSPWSCNSVNVEIKFHLEQCRLRFPCAQLVLRQMYLTNL